MSYEEIGIRLRTDGVVDATNGLNLAGKAVTALGTAGKDAAPGLTSVVDAAIDATTALPAMTASLSPLAVALGAAGAAGVALAVAANKGFAEQQAYQRAIILTGNAAGTTAGQLAAMAAQTDAVVGTQSMAADVLTQLVATGNVTRASLQQSAEAAISLQRSLGVEVSKTVAAFSALGDQPLKAAVKLNEAQHFLTMSTYEQIRALEQQGRTAEAAGVAQAAYAKVMNDRSKEMEGNLGTLQKGWRGLKEIASETWDAMLGVGRQSTVEQQLASVQIALASPIRRGGNTLQAQERREALREQEAQLQEMLRLQRRNADNQARVAADVEAKAEADAKARKERAPRRNAYDFVGPRTFDEDFKPANVGAITKTRDANRSARVAELESYDETERTLRKDRAAAEEADRKLRVKEEADQFELMGKLRSKFIDDAKPEWQRMLEGWQETNRLMATTWNETVGATLRAGEDEWVRWATTGKFNIRSVGLAWLQEQSRGAFRNLLGLVTGLSGPSNSNPGGGLDVIKNPSSVGALGGGGTRSGLGGSGRTLVYSPQISIDSRTDRAEVAALVQGAMRQSQADLIDKMDRGEI